MTTTLTRFMFLVVLALLQASFFNMLFPSLGPVPLILFSSAMAMTITLGFDRAVVPVIVFGLLSDIFSSDRIGVGVFFAVGIAYTASFFSRRYLFDHRLLLTVFATVLSGTAGIVFLVVTPAVFAGAALASGIGHILSWQRVSELYLTSMVLFLLVSFLVESFERRMSYSEAGAKLKW